MRSFRYRFIYLILLPAIALAAGVLGYFTYRAAAQHARLGEETIVQSTAILVSNKIEQIEQFIIEQDNALFSFIAVDDPATVERLWPRQAKELSPSIKAVMILDDQYHDIAYTMRGTPGDRFGFAKVFRKEILGDLLLPKARRNRLHHLHKRYGDRSYLISYKPVRHRSRTFYLIALHDAGHIIRNKFPTLFGAEEGKNLYNVVDENNRRVYGPSLAGAGDYLVGRRFPTTLYGWRLQVAPAQAPLLDKKGRSRQATQVALIASSFAIILLGLVFILYAVGKERRLNALKGEFVANVSHELKTPLSVIRMFGELLLTKRVRSEQKSQEYLELICRESERLSALIENVLDFAAVERGKREYDLQRGDLREVLNRAVETFRFRLQRDPVELRIVNQGPIGTVMMDEQAMTLAIINLLDNAAKYGESSPITVTLSQDGDRVSITVEDAGPGIPMGDLKRVFERFYRTRRSPQTRGSGIGLALVKGIAEAHRGRTWAENVDTGGARITITIPAAVPTENPAPDQPLGSAAV